jgi:putative serine protease PepD
MRVRFSGPARIPDNPNARLTTERNEDMLRKRATLLVVVVVAVVALAAVAAGAAVYVATARGDTRTVVERQPTIASTSSATSGLSVHQIYERAFKGVVEIAGSETTSTKTPFGAQKQKGTVEGSGFVYDRNDHVVTNYHVVKGTSSIRVAFADRSTYAATVVAADPSTDLAVLKVDAPASELHPLSLGDSSKAQVGDGVVAIGSPFGLAGTVTSGIVSALGRTISSDNSYSISGAIQTDAAINHGNSGGPLLDTGGRVVGVNSQIESEGGGNDGVGFAIPSNTVTSVVKQLLANGKVEHAYLGVSVGPPTTGSGARVGSVKKGSPAAEAGLKAGDVIKAFGSQEILSPDDLIAAVNAKQPSDKVTITYTRNGATKTAHVTLGSRA